MRVALLVAALIFASMPAVSQASVAWRDRWVEFAQNEPPSQAERRLEQREIASAPLPREVEPRVKPYFLVLLAFFGFMMIFATIEIVLRNEQRK